ncbi:hypothetical protein SAMN02745181_3596 [Rubritalea squalenifaciens DSM 18772]|uniref:Uncharacterized protein n=1 Tax=Rubritalea squalenifaciens DSM 18772 TaxID=1123071 RepID=A0A1M6RBD3_9BACT|nr:hypothetical protein SAMN02745181_3596 [Rubritalea squalenifaciens DSM 18772]
MLSTFDKLKLRILVFCTPKYLITTLVLALVFYLILSAIFEAQIDNLRALKSPLVDPLVQFFDDRFNRALSSIVCSIISLRWKTTEVFLNT